VTAGANRVLGSLSLEGTERDRVARSVLAKASLDRGVLTMNTHEDHCFIAAPFGKDDEEHAILAGWLEEAIVPAIEALKLKPEIATARNAPNAITLEIREHLAFDRLVVFDLGGVAPAYAPNPNVMYELGIRHAFDLPAIVLAWTDQPLPFDIAEHRVIRGNRHFGTIQWHREKVQQFGEAALKGEFFRPMEAVRRARMIEETIARSDNTALQAIHDEVRTLRRMVEESERLRSPERPIALPRPRVFASGGLAGLTSASAETFETILGNRPQAAPAPPPAPYDARLAIPGDYDPLANPKRTSDK
jgi:hypothetical protein